MTRMPVDDDTAALLRRHRRPEPSFVRAVATALGGARTVREVRPGPVSYVPADRDAVAAGDADATLLTFPTVDALTALALPAGGRVVVLARDPDRLRAGWLAEYASAVVAAEADTLPTIDRLATLVGPSVEVARLPVPFTCVDGFGESYYARDPNGSSTPTSAPPTRRGAWSTTSPPRRSVAALRNALASGEWDTRYGALRRRPTLDGSVVLLQPAP